MNAKEIVLAGFLTVAVFAGALYWINSNQKPPEPGPAVAQATTPEVAPAPRELDPPDGPKKDGPKNAGPGQPMKQGPAGNPPLGMGQPGGGFPGGNFPAGKTILSGPIGVKVVNSSSKTIRVVPLALGGNTLRLPPNDLGIVWLQPGNCTLHIYYQSPAGKEVGPLSGSVTADGSKDIIILEQGGKLSMAIR